MGRIVERMFRERFTDRVYKYEYEVKGQMYRGMHEAVVRVERPEMQGHWK